MYVKVSDKRAFKMDTIDNEKFYIEEKRFFEFWVAFFRCTDCNRKAEHEWDIWHSADCPRIDVPKECKPDCKCIGCQLGYRGN